MTDDLRPPCTCSGASRHEPKLVAITGGPGAGKTALLEMVRRNFCKHVAVTREAASIVFGGGFPRDDDDIGRRGAQRSIFAVHVELERMFLERRQAAVVLCDRGTLDGLAYWPGDAAEYFDELRTSRPRELARYAAVLHLRTPPATSGYDLSNPVRNESADEAARLDARILDAWTGHPRRRVVEATTDFLAKVVDALELIRAEVPPCCRRHELVHPNPPPGG